jgi:Ca2+-binding EF-hand superfamily protein
MNCYPKQLMKKEILILLGCAFAILPLGAEENKPDAPKRPGGPGGPGEKGGKGDGSFFREMDKDGDKAISKEEAGERWERLGKLDKDGDGKLTMQEMMAGRPDGGRPKGDGGPEGGPKGPPPGGGPEEMFKRADKNNDGKISKDEVPAEAWERLGKLDKDNDGAVSKEEARAGGPGAGGPGGSGGPGRGGPEMFARADKNKDGKLTKDEVPEGAWERMSKLDKDGDNAVSKEEMAAMMKGKGGPDGRPGGPGGPGGKGGPQGGPGEMLSRFDENKDGKLSKAEVPAEMWDKLSKADEDADGLVSKDELEKVYRARDGGGPRPERKPDGDRPKAKPEKEPAV